MSLFKILASVTLGLLCTVGLAAILKNRAISTTQHTQTTVSTPVQVPLNPHSKSLKPAPSVSSPAIPAPSIVSAPIAQAIPKTILSDSIPSSSQDTPPPSISTPPIPTLTVDSNDQDLPEANRIEELFSTDGPTLPIVETITYKSRVSWQKGRPAWLCDYANHYHTNIHFISRSINREPNYLKQEIKEGGKFNVFKNDVHFRFHLVVDTSKCKLWLYYVDLDEHKHELIKNYSVCLGRIDTSKNSGLLTPLGTYTLGKKTAIYDSKTTGNYRGKQVIMKTIFGTRWIPFEKELESCTLPAKGFGIHGTPWTQEKCANASLVEQLDSIGNYESDGCIRLATPDIEEIYAIVSSRPTQIEIVRSFSESSMAKE